MLEDCDYLNANVSDNHLPDLERTSLVDFYRYFLFPCTVLSYLLFPIYQFVTRQNKESDALTSVYPIVKHFNFVVKKMMLLLSVFIGLFAIYTCFVLWMVTTDPSGAWKQKIATKNTWNYIFFPIIGIVFFFMSFIPNIQYVLHFLLGLQRLLIYFFPEKEKYISWSERSLNRLLVVLYVVFFTLNLRAIYKQFMFTFYTNMNCKMDVHQQPFQLNILLSIIFLFLNGLQVLGALFYIPIMISVSKLTHLTSAAVNRPQKYIFYQIMIHLISRIGYLPTIFATSIPQIMFSIVVYDIVLTPFVIQVAYLLCNRRNVQTLLSSPWKVIIKSLIVLNYQPSQVQPAEVIESTKV